MCFHCHECTETGVSGSTCALNPVSASALNLQPVATSALNPVSASALNRLSVPTSALNQRSVAMSALNPDSASALNRLSVAMSALKPVSSSTWALKQASFPTSALKCISNSTSALKQSHQAPGRQRQHATPRQRVTFTLPPHHIDKDSTAHNISQRPTPGPIGSPI